MVAEIILRQCMAQVIGLPTTKYSNKKRSYILPGKLNK